jgi:hypothetical protein
MHTSPYVVPVYRAMTIVGTALSRDEHGDMVHTTVISTTLPDDLAVAGSEVRVVYELR